MNKNNSFENIKGKVKYLSHNFRNVNKIFSKASDFFNLIIIEDEQNEERFVLANNDYLLNYLDDNLLIGKKIALSKLLNVREKKHNLIFLRMTSKSKLRLSESSSHFSCIEGVVTNDIHASSGVYTLNKKITLITTAVESVAKIPTLRKGQRVFIYNGHVLPTKYSNYLPVTIVLCVKSYMKVVPHYDLSMESSRDFIVLMSKSFYLSPLHILKFIQIKEMILKLYPDLKKTITESNFMETVIKFIHPKLETNFTSRLDVFNEFKLSEDKCFYSQFGNPDSYQINIYFVQSIIEQCLPILEERKKDRILLHKSYDNIIWDVTSIKLDFIFGIVKLDEITGNLTINDSSGSIIFHIRSENFNILNQYVNVFVGIKNAYLNLEWFENSDSEHNIIYISTNEEDIEVLKTLDISANNDTIEGKHIWEVIDTSVPLFDKDDSSHLYIQLHPLNPYKQNIWMKLYFKQIHGYACIPFGTKILLNNDLLELIKTSFGGIYQVFNNQNLYKYNSIPLLKERNTCLLRRTISLENLNDIKENEPFSVSAVIVEKWIEVNQDYLSNEENKHFFSDLTLHLKLKSSELYDSNIPLTSFYLKKLHKRQFPLKLENGREIIITNVRKILSRGKNPYLIGSICSNISVLPFDEENVEKSLNSITAFLSQIALTKELVYQCNFTLESFIKIEITNHCPKCDTQLAKGGKCVYSGCHARNLTNNIMKLFASLQVEDFTSNAILIVEKIDQLRNILKIDDDLWDYFIEYLNHEDEFRYVLNRNTYNKDEQINKIFNYYFKLLPIVKVISFDAVIRYIGENPRREKQFYCIDIV